MGTFLQVINDEPKNVAGIRQAKMPLLVYVSREKRPSHSHHFKAGALNVLVLPCLSTSLSFFLLFPLVTCLCVQVHINIITRYH